MGQPERPTLNHTIADPRDQAVEAITMGGMRTPLSRLPEAEPIVLELDAAHPGGFERRGRIEANGTPSAEQCHHALRQVVGRCVFGVDSNPIAVEPQRWDGFSTLFALLAKGRTDLSASEEDWLAAMT